MATLPAYNPTVPYLGLIPGGLRHGLMIRIRGQMKPVADRFFVNIQTGPAVRPSDDVNIHLSVRPSERTIVRNHFERQQWGPEERIGGCPIERGSQFEILILAESKCYKVAVNGAHFCEFNHRLPLHRASYVRVDGDCTIQSIAVEGDLPSAPPMPLPGYSQPTFPANIHTHHSSIPALPGNISSHHSSIPSFPGNINSHHSNIPAYPGNIHSHTTSAPSFPSNPPYNPPYNPASAQPHMPPYYPGSASSGYGANPNTPAYPVQQNPYPIQTPYQQNPYPTQTPYYNQTTGTYPNTYHKSSGGGGTTALKYAAGIGGIGLGAYAISRAFGSSSSSSDSD